MPIEESKHVIIATTKQYHVVVDICAVSTLEGAITTGACMSRHCSFPAEQCVIKQARARIVGRRRDGARLRSHDPKIITGLRRLVTICPHLCTERRSAKGTCLRPFSLLNQNEKQHAKTLERCVPQAYCREARSEVYLCGAKCGANDGRILHWDHSLMAAVSVEQADEKAASLPSVCLVVPLLPFRSRTGWWFDGLSSR